MKRGWAICTPTQELFDEVISHNVETIAPLVSTHWCNYEGNTAVCYGYEDEMFMFATEDFLRYEDSEKYNWITIEQFREMVGSNTPDNTDNVNPKQALGLSSVPMNKLSPIACAYGSIGKLNGALKYGTSNYLGTDVIMSIYMDAIRRHLDAIMAGEEYDPADGVPHFGAILANVDIILCARAAGTLIDDRPLLKGYREEMGKLKPIVNHLKELHKDKNPKHYYLKDVL